MSFRAVIPTSITLCELAILLLMFSGIQVALFVLAGEYLWLNASQFTSIIALFMFGLSQFYALIMLSIGNYCLGEVSRIIDIQQSAWRWPWRYQTSIIILSFGLLQTCTLI